MDKQQMLAKIKEAIGEVEITRHGNCTNPVMIGDVLDWIDNNIGATKMINGAKVLAYQRYHKRKPIDYQPYECIKFVYDLLPTK